MVIGRIDAPGNSIAAAAAASAAAAAAAASAAAAAAPAAHRSGSSIRCSRQPYPFIRLTVISVMT